MDQTEGRLIEWDDARKFGFIHDSKGASVFAHIQDFPKHATPKVGDRLRFKLRQTPKGLRAVEIQGSKIKSPSVHSRWKNSAFFVALAIVVLGNIRWVWVQGALDGTVFGAYQGIYQQYQPLLIFLLPAFYGVMSLLTFVLYGIDKRRAIKQAWRIPEATLHLCELLGGWIGGFYGQKIWHHKTTKATYQYIFWLIVGLHTLIWADYLFFDFGSIPALIHWIFSKF